MNTNVLRKSLAVAVILLFIGVSIAPSININVVKASNDNDRVEVTTQACGIKGFGNTTVKLTRQQYQNLEQYLVDFRARLNKTTTREEAVPIFKEAVVELNKYGLLPRGMSVQKAEKLVTGEYLNKKTMDALELLAKKKMVSNETNYLCPTAGHIFNPLFITPLVLVSTPFLVLWMFILLRFMFQYLGPILEFLINCLLLLCAIPVIILYDISFISPVSIILYSWFEGCNLSTIGLLGMKNFNVDIEYEIYGFVGMKLMVDGFGLFAHDVYLLGFSLYVGEPR
jgi:hypothetical protein